VGVLKKVGLGINTKKTKGLPFNTDYPTPLKTLDGTEIEWVESSEKDIAVRKALAWQALNKMSRIWRSAMRRDLKLHLFIATIESILLYGCQGWTLTVALEKSLNGTYTPMFRKVLDTHWSSYTTNEILYGNLPTVSDKIVSRRMQLAGHCFRHPELRAQ
jgi:hypothetical protein